MISGRSRVSPDVGRRGTDGTILDHTHLPLLTWFWATYLMVTRPGLNASTLGTQLGMSSRKNIHATLTRLRAAMAAYDPPQLGGVVEADKMVVGGYGAGAQGFRVVGTKKQIVLVAVERGTTRTRMAAIPDRRGKCLVPQLVRLAAPGSQVVTDGHNGYSGLVAAGFTWTRIPHPPGGLKKGAGRATPAVDGATSRLKRWLLGTYDKPPADHAPYLAESCFRSEFAGRPALAFETLLGLLAR